MKVISALLRIACGLALIISACATYRRASAHIFAGLPVQIAGLTIGASPGQFAFALTAVGLIGLFFIILGVLTLIRRKASGAAGQNASGKIGSYS